MTYNSDPECIYFVYDGECPLCQKAALALRIKKRYGELTLIDARTDQTHPLMVQINELKLDLDEGMVIYDGMHFYHGKSALRFMARHGENEGVFNLSNKLLFWSENAALVIYPWLRGLRNWLIRKKNVGRIDNLAHHARPIFQPIFGEAWQRLPPVFQKHYANRPYSADQYRVTGKLDVMCAGPIKWFAWVFWMMRGIPPQNENNVPVTVDFKSDENSKALHFDRCFYFQHKTYRFHSKMIQIKDAEVAEIMDSRFGWRLEFLWQDQQVKLVHKGYVLALFGHLIPLPITWLIGQGYAQEWSINDEQFEMTTNITHPLWGKVYQYNGQFRFESTS